MTASPSATSSFVSLWNGKLVVPAGLVKNLISIRISATGDLEAYENQHATAETIFSDLPDFHHLQGLPKEVRAPGAENDALRKSHGVIPLYSSDLPNAGHRRDLLGYAFLGGSNLWLFVMNSAAEGNLPPWPGDPTRQERNAFTELVVGAAVDLYDGGSKTLALRFALWSRMERYEPYGARMRAVVRDRPGMELYNGTQRVDLHDPSAQIVNAVNSGQSNAALLDLKGALYNGNLNHLADNRWEKPECFLPLGYRFRHHVSAEGLTTIVRGEVVADTTHQAALQVLVAMAASGSSWIAIGRRAAELKVPLRNLVGRGKTFASLPETSLSRAAKGLLANRAFISLWRTGSMVVRRVSPIDGALTIRGRQLSFDEGATRGHVDTIVTWPLPDGGWGIPQETWERLLERLEREAERDARVKRPRGVAASDLARRAFSGAPTWSDGVHEFRLLPETPTAYRLRRRDTRDGLDARGRPRGWRKDEGEVIGTFHGLALHASVSLSLESALATLADAGTQIGTLPVLEVTARRRATSGQQVRDLLVEAEELENRARAFDDLTVTAHTLGHAGQVATYMESAARCRDDAEAKRAEAKHVDELDEAEAASDEPVSLDLAQPALVAVALRRFPQHGPATLVAAVAALGLTDSLRVELSDDPGTAHWRASCRVPVIGEDAVAVVEISGVVPNSAPPAGGLAGGRHSFATSIARLILVEQMDIDAVAITHHRKSEWVNRRILDWLRSNGVTAQGLAFAALHCPVSETRRAIFAACSGDESVVAGLAPAFVAHVRETYLGSRGMTSWTPGAMRPQRQLLAALATAPNGAAIKHDLAATLGVTPRDVAAVARGWSKRGAIVDRVGLLEMRLKRCPHPDCAGHPGYLAQYLVTPETRGGLICTACRRTPERADVVFPPAYLQAWEGPDVNLGVAPAPVEVEATELLSASQVCEQLGWSRHEVATRLTPARHVGRMALYHPNDVEALRGVGRTVARRQRAGTYSVPEVARLLGVSSNRIRQLIERGACSSRGHTNERSWRYLDDAAVASLRTHLSPADRVDAGLLSTGQAAARLGLSPQALRLAVTRGRIPAQRTSDGRFRFDPADLAGFSATAP